MHKRITLTLLLIVLFPAGLTWAAYGDGIRGSKHDFSAASWDEFNKSGEICIFCHAPHDQGRTTYENGLLWNRAVSQTPYTMYTNGYAGFTSLDGAVDSTPTGSSKLCLACHDGTLAMDSYGEHSGGIHTMWDENLSRVIPRAMDGSNLNLRGSHPISIVYSAATDGELHDRRWRPGPTAQAWPQPWRAAKCSALPATMSTTGRGHQPGSCAPPTPQLAARRRDSA